MTETANSPDRDEQTLQLLIEGHPDGLQRLIEDHGSQVHGHLQRKFRNLLDDWQIDEAMSLAAVRVWQSAPRFVSSTGRLRAWFAVIARNCALSLLAHKQGEPLIPIDGVDPMALGLARNPGEAERMRMIIDVHRCIDTLPKLQRMVLLADLNAGTTLSAPELAARFDSTVQSIYVARTCGRRELRRMLERLGYGQWVSRGNQKPAMPPGGKA